MKAFLAPVLAALILPALPCAASYAQPGAQTPAEARSSANTDAVPSDADLRCVLVLLNASSEATDPTVKQNLTAAGYYFLGRVDMRSSATALTDRIYAVEQAMTPDLVASDQQRCQQLLQTRAQAFDTAVDAAEQRRQPAPH